MHYRNLIVSIFIVLIASFIVPAALSAENSCLNCHSKLSAFNETERLFNEIRVKHLARDVACSLDCHVNILEKFAKSNYEQWINSKHAMFNVTCNNCHGGDPGTEIKETAHKEVLRSSDPSSTVYYINVPETCGKCHTEELKQFQSSSHYQKLKALKQAPTCDTCHQPHEFKVLNVSEFHGLCNNCHNIEMRIAPSDAPDKAIAALMNTDKLKEEIKNADNAIRQAKQEGKDVSKAQSSLDAALSIQANLPVLWHSFNLPNFENITNSGIKSAQQATLDTGVPIEKPRTPGFDVMLFLTGLASIYLLRRKR